MSRDIAGIHAALELLRHNPSRCLEAWIKEEPRGKALADVLHLLQKNRIPVHEVPKSDLDRKFRGAHQGVILGVAAFKYTALEDVLGKLAEQDPPPALLVLDHIQDPHNFGAIIRTAEATGCGAVIVTKDKQVDVTPIVTKASAGAADIIPIVQVTNMVRALETIKEAGYWVYGLAGEADRVVHALDLEGKVALVAGAEGSGLRPGIRKACDELCSLPMKGRVGSYNVSVAVGMALGELVRQQERCDS